MKKQISKKRFSFIMIVIFYVTLPAINSSCKKGTTAENKNIDTPPGSTIIYTDINPDTALTGFLPHKIYNLDLNNDGITDFVFSRDISTSICNTDFNYNLTIINLSVKPANGNNAIINDGASHAYALDSTAAIVQDSLWSTTSQVLLIGARGSGRCVASFRGSGYWFNVSDKYLGLKFIKGNYTYYGWARLTASFYYAPNPQLRDGKVIIKDYAYNSSPNRPLLAGQKK